MTFSLVSLTLYKILEWHYKTWKREKAYFNDEEKKRIWLAYSELSRVLSSIIKSIEERSLKEGESHLFFTNLKKHWTEHKDEDKYLEHLFALFYRVFFENIENVPDRDNVWISFPQEWLVTKSRLGKNNFISRLSLDQFLKLAAQRIPTKKKETDVKLDILSYSLFPEVEPTVWAKLLIFLFAPMTSNNTVKDVIEHPWNFGLTGMPSGGYRLPKEDDETDARKAHEEEVRNAFELATILHEYNPIIPKDTFTEGNLINYRNELEGLKGKYKDDSLEEVKRSGLLHVFEEMREFLHDREKQVT